MINKSWKKCKKALQKELSQEEFNAWINPLEFSVNKSPSGNKDLFILAPNAFIKEQREKNPDAQIPATYLNFTAICIQAVVEGVIFLAVIIYWRQCAKNFVQEKKLIVNYTQNNQNNAEFWMLIIHRL